MSTVADNDSELLKRLQRFATALTIIIKFYANFHLKKNLIFHPGDGALLAGWCISVCINMLVGL